METLIPPSPEHRLFVAVHTHKYGTDVLSMWSDHKPTIEDVILTSRHKEFDDQHLGMNYDPTQGETLKIHAIDDPTIFTVV